MQIQGSGCTALLCSALGAGSKGPMLKSHFRKSKQQQSGASTTYALLPPYNVGSKHDKAKTVNYVVNYDVGSVIMANRNAIPQANSIRSLRRNVILTQRHVL